MKVIKNTGLMYLVRLELACVLLDYKHNNSCQTIIKLFVSLLYEISGQIIGKTYILFHYKYKYVWSDYE